MLMYLRLGECRPALGVLNSTLLSNLPGVTGQARYPSGFGWKNEATTGFYGSGFYAKRDRKLRRVSSTQGTSAG